MPLSAERWEIVKSLFDAALEREPAARTDFLASASGSDDEVRKEVESLLAAFDKEDGRFEQPALVSLAGLDDDERLPTESLVGRRVGPYELVREVGRGGMGAVYEAYRTPEEFRNRVAIKMLAGGRRADVIVHGFRHERQILARLEHPNIARFLDGGFTNDGQPWFAMEFVEGEPIDAHCGSKQLTVRQRLELFRQVCGAVQYAHRNLVVHRDLKPSNVLVTADGTAKLLDFGIAKLLDREGDTGEGTLTRAGFHPLTTAYASPEQLRRETVTTASDVYSLGVVLYELLAGRRPFEIERESPSEVARLLETEPTKPSAVVSEEAARATGEGHATRLRRALAGELDNIVLMALRKEPERRYASAEQLSDDIQRYLDGRPVRAQRDTTGYRLRKFVRRNRTGVAAASLAALALVVGSTVAVWQARRATEQARVAERERATAQQINAFLLTTLGAADASYYTPSDRVGPKTTVAEAIDAAVKTLGSQLRGQPDVEANLRATIGRVYRVLGRYSDSRAQLDSALALHRRVDHGPHLEVAGDLAELGTGYLQRGNVDTAIVLLREARAMLRALGDTVVKQPGDTLGFKTYLGATENLGSALRQRGRSAEAASLYHETLAGERRLFGDVHPGVATTLNNIGTVFDGIGQADSAEYYQRAAVDVYEKLRARTKREYYEEAFALGNVAMAVARRSLPEAESLFTRALAISDRTLGVDAPFTMGYRIQLAYVHQRMGQNARAVSELDHVLEVLGRTVAPTHRHVASALLYRALALVELGRARDAERDARRALEVERANYPKGSFWIESYQNAVGYTLSAQRRFAEAEPILLRTYERITAAVGPYHTVARAAARRLAQHFELKGDSARAASYRALSTMPPPESPARRR